ncbi:hypothetical protein [Oscillatoria acuminata]|uniref:Uncharacterized protein n=1 Tax=Oscillatoria acuminata PCC 6304 TaxID=56110 RepID=K9TSX9_9CYAN|nr:hypothetical protein [Oscillatoria acuminata]AFY85124.1 hypothetical protein Oscil6304_5648 [Oscillatoria acuminata PCC 6304]
MSEPSSQPKSPLGFDEIIAIFVAFSTLGTIFILSFPSTERGLNMFETGGTRSPGSEGVVPREEQTPQTPVNPFVNPGQVPAVGPQSGNPTNSPEGNSTPLLGGSTAWGGLALPLFSPNPDLNPTEAPTGEGSGEVSSPSQETPILSSPTTEETIPTESEETPNPSSSPSATPTTEGTTDSTPNP